MKEITTEITLKITSIETVNDSEVDEHIEHDRDKDIQKNFAKAVAAVIGADKVDVSKVRHFIMDIDHKEPTFITTETFFDDSPQGDPTNE